MEKFIKKRNTEDSEREREERARVDRQKERIGNEEKYRLR